MNLIYSTLYSLIAILSYTTSYVLLAANIDDVRTIAKKFVPDSIAEDILNRARDAINRDNDREQERESKKAFNLEYQTQLRNNKTKKDTLKMDLDELVEKVKQRLQSEFKLLASTDKKAPGRYIKQSRDDTNPTNQPTDYPTSPDRYLTPDVQQAERQHRTPVQHKQTSHYNKKTTDREEHITTENSEIYEKFILGNTNDSYEEYVEPKKDVDYKELKTEAPSYKAVKKVDTIGELRQPDRHKILDVFSDEDKTTSKSKVDMFYYDETLNFDNKMKNYNHNNNKEAILRKPLAQAHDSEPMIQTYAKQLENAAENDKPITEADTAISELVILEDYKEKPTRKPIMLQENINRGVRKPKKSTLIPKRDFYKISTPNYLLQMPIIGEKYRFDEPIPEEDRVPETLKYVGNPPASINGKVSLTD